MHQSQKLPMLRIRSFKAFRDFNWMLCISNRKLKIRVFGNCDEHFKCSSLKLDKPMNNEIFLEIYFVCTSLMKLWLRRKHLERVPTRESRTPDKYVDWLNDWKKVRQRLLRTWSKFVVIQYFLSILFLSRWQKKSPASVIIDIRFSLT